ncbi:MAG: hypothetical protein PHN84_12875 [Desulfuromonadaceae bacterium]|nr:hypothetical protein [Desulfuromonadaceae bacterium]MDD2856464.1 hypothetical protein [Desulfuromonadaceae bacterium]
MDDLTANNISYALIRHQLISCNSETKVKEQTNQGGKIEFSLSVETPDTPDVLHTGDIFSVGITMKTDGKKSSDNSPLFNVTCKMEGTYKIFACPDNGIMTEGNNNFWALASRQLLPLVAQYTSDILTRMGFKNILVPSFLPEDAIEKSGPKPRKKKIK